MKEHTLAETSDGLRKEGRAKRSARQTYPDLGYRLSNSIWCPAHTSPWLLKIRKRLDVVPWSTLPTNQCSLWLASVSMTPLGRLAAAAGSLLGWLAESETPFMAAARRIFIQAACCGCDGFLAVAGYPERLGSLRALRWWDAESYGREVESYVDVRKKRIAEFGW